MLKLEENKILTAGTIIRMALNRKRELVVVNIVGLLVAAFALPVPFLLPTLVDEVVLGGGNAKLMKELPHGVRLGHNLTAFRGGFRLWNIEDVVTHPADGSPPAQPAPPTDWRLL